MRPADRASVALALLLAPAAAGVGHVPLRRPAPPASRTTACPAASRGPTTSRASSSGCTRRRPTRHRERAERRQPASSWTASAAATSWTQRHRRTRRRGRPPPAGPTWRSPCSTRASSGTTRNAMVDVRRKTRINQGEAQGAQARPRGLAARGAAGLAAPATTSPPRYDANGDGVFNVLRLRLRHPRGDRPRPRASAPTTCSTRRTS